MSEILVEVIPKGGANVPLGGGLRERFEDRATEIAESLRSIAEAFRSEFDREAQDGAGEQQQTWVMEEVTLNLSLNLEATAGIVIARGKTGAAFQASLKWRLGGA